MGFIAGWLEIPVAEASLLVSEVTGQTEPCNLWDMPDPDSVSIGLNCSTTSQCLQSIGGLVRVRKNLQLFRN